MMNNYENYLSVLESVDARIRKELSAAPPDLLVRDLTLDEKTILIWPNFGIWLLSDGQFGLLTAISSPNAPKEFSPAAKATIEMILELYRDWVASGEIPHIDDACTCEAYSDQVTLAISPEIDRWGRTAGEELMLRTTKTAAMSAASISRACVEVSRRSLAIAWTAFRLDPKDATRWIDIIDGSASQAVSLAADVAYGVAAASVKSSWWSPKMSERRVLGDKAVRSFWLAAHFELRRLIQEIV